MIPRRACALACLVALEFLAISGAAERVEAREPAQQNHSRKFGPGECGPVDASYIRVADETGGQPFFLNPSETAKAFHFVRETSIGDQAMLLRATGTLDDGRVHDFAVPIDSTSRRVTFSLSVNTSGSDFAVIDPSGAAVDTANDRTEITVMNCGRIVTQDAPALGTWHVRVGGVGRFWLSVHAKTELSFVTAEFVRMGGRPGHEGLFRIQGQPIAGTVATLRAVVSRERTRTAKIDLVSPHGDVIQTLDVSTESTGSSDEFLGTFVPPSEPFRVRVSGLDDAGHPYQRVFHTQFHAETVEVIPPAAVDDLSAGAAVPLTFTVRNVGTAAASFRIIAADGRRFVTRFEPRTLSLEAATEAAVTVWVSIPPETAAGTGFDVTVTASGEPPAHTMNGASLHLGVAGTRGK